MSGIVLDNSVFTTPRKNAVVKRTSKVPAEPKKRRRAAVVRSGTSGKPTAGDWDWKRLEEHRIVRQPVTDTVIHIHRNPPGTGSAGALNSAAGSAAGAAAGAAAGTAFGKVASSVGSYLATGAALKVLGKGARVAAGAALRFTPQGRALKAAYGAYKLARVARTAYVSGKALTRGQVVKGLLEAAL